MPFKISLIGELYDDKESFLHDSKSNALFEIVWIIEGEGVHYIDLQEWTVAGNSLFFILPGQIHYLKLDPAFTGYVISFSDTFISREDSESNSNGHTRLFKMFATAKTFSMDNGSLADMKNIAEKMLMEFKGYNLLRAEMLERYFKIFLIYITRQLEESINSCRLTRNIEIVQQYMDLLEKNYKEVKMVSDYASMLSVTPNYLNEIIKKTTGHSAGHHIRQRIVLEAKRQARYSGNCMKEIAYFLGFADMGHFSKFFKNETGMNFTDFKKEKFVLSNCF